MLNGTHFRSKRLQLPSQSQEVDQKRLLCSNSVGWYSPINRGKLSTSFTTRCRKPHLPVVRNQMRPDCGVGSPDLDECLASLSTENDVILKENPTHYDANGDLHGLTDTTPSQPHPPDALIAGSLSKNDYKTVKEVTNFVLKIGLFTGIALAVILGFSFSSLATLFTQDAELLAIVRTGVLVCRNLSST